MHLGSSLSLSCHLHGHPRACGLFTLILPFCFLLYLPPLFLFLNYLKSVVNLHNSCNESMDSTDEFSLSTPTALGSSASYSPGTFKAKGSNLDLTSTGKRAARGLNENTASSAQVWHSGVNTNTSMGRPVAATTKKPIGTKLYHHNLQMSMNKVGHLEKVQSHVRQKLSRPQGEEMLDIDANAMIW